MADKDVVGDHEPLLSQEGLRRSSISLAFFKFIGAVLLASAACYLFIGNFNAWTPETENHSLPLEEQDGLNIRPLRKESSVREQQLKKEVCDLSVGEWVPNPEGPAYTDKTCDGIPGYNNCLKNGRPDRGYLYWRWKPRFCDLPPFDPVTFLDAMRDKSWAFIGDSIYQNHVHSLLCQLSQVEEPQILYHDQSFDIITFYFPSHNFTIYEIWAPLLVQYETIDNAGDSSQKYMNLHLDILDSKWTRFYNQYDYMVLSGSPWFYKPSIIFEKSEVIGCHYCPGLELKEYGAARAYRKALQLTLNFIAASEHKPFVIVRTWPPSHYEAGDSPTERICNRTKPFREGEISGAPADLNMREVEIEEYEKAAPIGARNGVRIELLDFYHPFLLRPDGHPGPYGTYHPFDGGKKQNDENDCIHWCLPGPIDNVNDMLMKMVINGDIHDSASAML
ncbi:protein trichome birefringence-like 26 [Dioscorea cayenensis subsp. rotundata]|uniref:Protein trichome birefringence-like 26 n=1 Tax=Dioscorea cayennensis subsp. rotundata TaxID=55577 RepID=A0AB40B2K5_DIOCR|nr:protein trichome birefringence-like 26 [Dioscorea cayenensis subsp. rotundata]